MRASSSLSARARWISAGSTWYTTTKIVNYRSVLDTAQSADQHTRSAADSSTVPQAVAAAPPVGEVKTVNVSGDGFAQINEDGFFQYLPQPEQVKQQFSVKYLGAGTGWRIATPPDFRMVTPEAFKRAYQINQSPLPVYLPSRGLTPHLDQVYLTQATGKVDDTYNALAKAVLHGRYPAQSTKLELQNPVTVDSNGTATVKLKPPPGGVSDITDVQQALYQTFRDASETPQLLSPTPLASVVVTYDGCSSSACQPASTREPVTAQAPLVYWVCPQGQNGTEAAIVSQQPAALSGASPTVCPENGGKAQSVVGMSGVSLQKASPIAVKQISASPDVKPPAEKTVVAVVEHNGFVVVLDDKNSDQKVWYTASDPSKVTDLEWDPVDGSLWVVDDGGLVRVRDPGNTGPTSDSQQKIPVPGGSVTRFKPSPDGLRAVVVNPPAASSSGTASTPTPPWMATIDRAGDTVTVATAQGTAFQLLPGSTQTADSTMAALQSVTDAAWADGRTVVLLGVQSGSSTPALYKVYLDGTQDSRILEPDDAQTAATHIAAATSILNGHPSMWTISEAPGPTSGPGAGATYTYFKGAGSSDSFQQIGWSPVTATMTTG